MPILRFALLALEAEPEDDGVSIRGHHLFIDRLPLSDVPVEVTFVARLFWERDERGAPHSMRLLRRWPDPLEIEVLEEGPLIAADPMTLLLIRRPFGLSRRGVSYVELEIDDEKLASVSFWADGSAIA